MKKVIVSLMLAMGFMTASAQEQQPQTETVFNPHWFVQVQGGAQYTLGEISFGDLISPNVQVSGGYNFSELFGLRLSVNAWQSKAGGTYNIFNYEGDGYEYSWKWNYINPNVDAILNISNLIAGYNPNRLFNVSAFVGVGANIAFNNGEAKDVRAQIISNYGNAPAQSQAVLAKYWEGTKTFFTGRAGIMGDFRITDNWSVGLELNATVLADSYNSKDASTGDWYFNGLIGVKYAFGKTNTTREKAPCCEPEIRYVEKIVEKIVEKEVPVEVVKEVVVEPIRRDVFFALNSTKVTDAEMVKIKEIADYLKANPNAKVSVLAHADKGTGTASINKRISEKRAKVVTDYLINKFGISTDRISSEAFGDIEQPFSDNSMNRVCICIAK